MNDEAPLIGQLLEIPFFKGMSQEQILELKSVSDIKEYRAGEEVFREGEKGDSLYFILDGTVEVRKRFDKKKEQVIANLGRNASFGEIAFILENERTATVKASADVRLMRLTRKNFNVLLNMDSSSASKLLFNLLVNLAGRLTRTNLEMALLLSELEKSSATSKKVDKSKKKISSEVL